LFLAELILGTEPLCLHLLLSRCDRVVCR